jgi:hypothetical protein
MIHPGYLSYVQPYLIREWNMKIVQPYLIREWNMKIVQPYLIREWNTKNCATLTYKRVEHLIKENGQ